MTIPTFANWSSEDHALSEFVLDFVTFPCMVGFLQGHHHSLRHKRQNSCACTAVKAEEATVVFRSNIPSIFSNLFSHSLAVFWFFWVRAKWPRKIFVSSWSHIWLFFFAFWPATPLNKQVSIIFLGDVYFKTLLDAWLLPWEKVTTRFTNYSDDQNAFGLADIQNWNRNWHRNSEIVGAGPHGIDRRTSEPDIDAFDAIALRLWTRSDRPLHSTGIRQSGPSSGTQDTHTRYSFCVLCKRLLCHVIAKCRMCNKYVNLETVFAFF